MSVGVVAEHVSRIYFKGGTEVRALDDVSMSVTPGDFVALMGPSGSGKSTLMNLVAGIDRADKGVVRVAERDVAAMSESERTAWRTRTVGYIFQFYNLMPVLTAFENVELPLLLMPLSKIQRRDHVRAALDAVGLSDRDAHFPAQLSGGQQQRVAIARAIVADAAILLADEPTGNLDAQAECEVLDLLRRLNSEFKKTIIMVTHDATAAAAAQRVVRLEKGRLVETPVKEGVACSSN